MARDSVTDIWRVVNSVPQPCEKSLDFSGYQYHLYTESAAISLSFPAQLRGHTPPVQASCMCHVTNKSWQTTWSSNFARAELISNNAVRYLPDILYWPHVLSDKIWTKGELSVDWVTQSRDAPSEQLLVLAHWVCLDRHLFEFSVHGCPGKGVGGLDGNESGVRVEGNVEGVGCHLLEGQEFVVVGWLLPIWAESGWRHQGCDDVTMSTNSSTRTGMEIFCRIASWKRAKNGEKSFVWIISRRKGWILRRFLLKFVFET